MSSKRESENVSRAKDILRGVAATLKEFETLVKKLKNEKAFGFARKVLQRACLQPDLPQYPQLRTWFIQQHALCTYKDPDLSPESKFDDALTILKQLSDLYTLEKLNDFSTAEKRETLGLAGAIHKDKWETYGQKQYLEQSLAFYQRGYHLGIPSDDGYNAINTAFVLDLLACIDRGVGTQIASALELAESRQKEATQIRQEIVAALDPETKLTEKEPDWWRYVTIAEAYFGLGREDSNKYKKAREWLKKAANLPNVPEWTYEATARQLATLARIQATVTENTEPLAKTPAWQVLQDFLGAQYAAGIQGIFLGKVGLALSGGGFRASLFHIGVLAQLAELDMLRHVEVLSCVSGGSIIGAHYYLELRKLLQRPDREDTQVTREDYIKIVQNIEQHFLAGVQRNIRVRLLADFWANLKMIFKPNTYSRTLRAGELYEEEIFSRVTDGEESKPRYISKLLIKPTGEPQSFAPKSDNWRRAAKVPMLILNATTLNTGHNWQFTATWMGEPPSGIDAEIDSNYRLRRMYYDEAPRAYREKDEDDPSQDRTTIRLGHAVAASACVPGIFDPIVYPDLYPDITVRLVDGGVYDNQGTSSLLEQGCTVTLVSDASGQMAAQDEPSRGILGTPLRASSISQARVRTSQYHELDARRRASLLRGFMFVHLKKALTGNAINWVECEDPQDAYDCLSASQAQGLLTPYGIRKDVQECLAAVRTDLDSFSDTEAYALMNSGYHMTQHEFPQNLLASTGRPDTQPVHWKFLAIEDSMKERDKAADLKRFLTVSSELFLKVWRLAPPKVQKMFLALIALPTGVGFFWACWYWSSLPLLTLGRLGKAAFLLLLGFLIGKKLMRIVRFRETLTQIGMGIGLSAVGCWLARVHLKWFDQRYLDWGHVETELSTPLATSTPPLDSPSTNLTVS